MKRVSTLGFLFSTLTQSARPITSLINTKKHKVKFKAILGCLINRLKNCGSCQFGTLEQTLVYFSGCFGLQNLKQPPGYEDPAILAAVTAFSVKEVEALYELFTKLSSSMIDDGLIQKEEFQLALFRNSKRENLFSDRLFALFDMNENGVIEFGEFVRSLSVFHPNTLLEEKINFAFKLYDLRQTGFIEREEVKKMLIALFSESEMQLSDTVISAILDKTFFEVDLNQDGKIDREEWKIFVSKHPLLMNIMTLPYLKDVMTSFPSFVFYSEVEMRASFGM